MNYQESNIYFYLKVLIVSIVLLGKSNFLLAQNNVTNCAMTYESWSKRNVIEVLYVCMKDYISTVSDAALPKQRIIKNNNWLGAKKNDLQPLLIYLSKKNKFDSYLFSTLKFAICEKCIAIFRYSIEMLKRFVTVSSIVSDYNEDLKNIDSKQKASIVANDDSFGLTNQKGTEENIGLIDVISTNWLILLIFVILSCVLSVIIALFFLKSMLNKFIEEYDQLMNRISKYHDKIKRLEEKIQHIDEAVKLSKDSNIVLKSNSNTIDPEQIVSSSEYSEKSIEWDILKEVENKTITYFSIPESDGRFIIEKGEQTNDGSKYYKIVYRTDSDEGELLYICGPQDKRAINRLDTYLMPVCDIENIANAESTIKIEVLKNGKVFKITDSWVIDTDHKVKIKLV